MFSFTRLVLSKVQDTANNEHFDLGPGNNYTRSLEGLTRERLKMLTDRSGCGRLGTKVD